MPYFSRLTDIVTCSLSDLLAEAEDPGRALAEIIAEMEQGSAGAARAVATAAGTVARVEGELGARRGEIDRWDAAAKEELKAGNEDAAKAALVRRREARDMVAALEQELESARGTHDAFADDRPRPRRPPRRRPPQTGRARQRWRRRLHRGRTHAAAPPGTAAAGESVDDELEALRKELAGE